MLQPDLPPRQCESPECGKDYQPPTHRSRYCSPYCMHRARYLRYSARDVANGERAELPTTHYRTERVCERRGCRKPFMPGHPRARFCSHECNGLERLAVSRDATAARRQARARAREWLFSQTPCEHYAAE